MPEYDRTDVSEDIDTKLIAHASALFVITDLVLPREVDGII